LAPWRCGVGAGDRRDVGVREVALDRACAGERLVRANVVVELSEVVDHRGHLDAVGGQVAPEHFDLDGAVVALDDAVWSAVSVAAFGCA